MGKRLRCQIWSELDSIIEVSRAGGGCRSEFAFRVVVFNTSGAEMENTEHSTMRQDLRESLQQLQLDKRVLLMAHPACHSSISQPSTSRPIMTHKETERGPSGAYFVFASSLDTVLPWRTVHN
jgi:hypothetical protein